MRHFFYKPDMQSKSKDNPNNMEGGCVVRVLALWFTVLVQTSAVTLPDNFELGTLSKVDTPTGFRLTLTYTGTSKPEVALRIAFGEPLETISHDLGRVDIEVPNNYSDVDLFITLPSILLILNVNVEVRGSREESIPNIELQMPAGRDVIYSGNDDVTFNVTVKSGRYDGFAFYDSLKWIAYVKNISEAGDTVYDEYPWFRSNLDERQSYPLKLTSEPNEALEGFYEFQLRTSEQIEGIAELTTFVRFYRTHGMPSLLGNLQTLTSVRFYREEKDGQFLSDSMVGFVRDDPEEDFSVTACQLSRGEPTTCRIGCAAVGNLPSDIDIVKIEPDGTRTPVDSTVNYRFLEHRVNAVAILQNVGEEEAGEYRCFARAGAMATEKRVILDVSQMPEIIEELTYAQRDANGSLEARCVADGIPAPRVSFTIGSLNKPLADVFGPYHEVIMTSLNATVTQATLRIPDPEHSLSLTHVQCHARNGLPFTTVLGLRVIDL